MLSEPAKTDFDINFSLFGYAVRVSPLFFILPALFSRNLSSGFPNFGVAILLVIGIYFVSILVHEFGHALAFRRYGISSYIVLYLMGGLAVPTSGGWGNQSKGGLTPNQHMFVSFAGPLAGFILAGVLVLLGVLLGGKVVWGGGLLPLPFIAFQGAMNNPSINLVFNGGIAINILLNLLNLVPVFPLDGGQIARQFFEKIDPRDGYRNSLILSIVVGGVLAFVGLQTDMLFLAILFGLLAFQSYQLLQMRTGRGW